MHLALGTWHLALHLVPGVRCVKKASRGVGPAREPWQGVPYEVGQEEDAAQVHGLPKLGSLAEEGMGSDQQGHVQPLDDVLVNLAHHMDVYVYGM